MVFRRSFENPVMFINRDELFDQRVGRSACEGWNSSDHDLLRFLVYRQINLRGDSKVPVIKYPF
jgi:hypothetical protein